MSSNSERAPASPRRPISRGRKLLFLLVVYGLFALALEGATRVFLTRDGWTQSLGWTPSHTRTAAGNKGWPGARCLMYSREFRVPFTYNELGYRSRETASPSGAPKRVAFVGDSLTEALQVPDRETFVAGIERALQAEPGVRCENFGISGSGPLEAYHRIRHDVLPTRPNAVVLCLFPGNDFVDACPEGAFDDLGMPRAEFFRPHRFRNQVSQWVVSHSKLCWILYRSWLAVRSRQQPGAAGSERPWWQQAPPAAVLASEDVQRRLTLIRGMDVACRAAGAKFGILVVGPDPDGYAAVDGKSPVVELLKAAKIDVPVLDVAQDMAADRQRLIFPYDEHPNAEGHRLMAERAAPFVARLAGVPVPEQAGSLVVQRAEASPQRSQVR